MQAAVYYGPRDIRVEDVPMPGLAENELLIRIQACGICGADLHMYRLGMFEALGRRVDNGRIMGHELSGEVVAVGPKVTGFEVERNFRPIYAHKACRSFLQTQRAPLRAAQSCVCEIGARATVRARLGPDVTTQLRDDLRGSRLERSITPHITYKIGTLTQRPWRVPPRRGS
jgi:Zn-dependent alcohol dehydrogenase